MRIQKHLLIFLGIKLIEGVGLDKTPLDGFHSSFSLSLIWLFSLVSEASVCALSLGLMYYGYLPIGSPWPFLASLNLF